MLKIIFNLCIHSLIIFFIIKKIFKLKKYWKISYTINFFAFFFFFFWLFILVEFTSMIRIIYYYQFFILFFLLIFPISIIFFILFLLQTYKDPTAKWWICFYDLLYFKLSNNLISKKNLKQLKFKYFLIKNEIWKFIFFAYFLLIIEIFLLFFFFFFFFYVNNLTFLNLLISLKIYKIKFFFLFYFFFFFFISYYTLFMYSFLNYYFFRNLNFYIIPGVIDKLENSTIYLNSIKYIEMRFDIYIESVYPLDDWYGLKNNPMEKDMQITLDNQFAYSRMAIPYDWIDFKSYILDSQQVDNCLYKFNRKLNKYIIIIFSPYFFNKKSWIISWLECHKKYEANLI